MKLLASLLALGALATTASAQFETISFETFDYPFPGIVGNQNGGVGWANSWWAGGNGDDVVVQADPPTNPGNPFPWAGGDDGVGNYAQQNIEFGGAYRFPDAGAHPDVTDNLMFGVDGSKLWFTFKTRRIQSFSTDNYGGFSLNEQGVGEKLFVGSPWQANGWGIDDQVNGAALAVGGPSQDAGGTVVVSIDYQVGDEQLHMWVDPTSAHPDPNVEAPLLSSLIADHRWNEIRISSGGGSTLYYWDAIHIEKESRVLALCDPAAPHSGGLSASIQASGSLAAADAFPLHLECVDGPPGEFGFFLLSATGVEPGVAVGNGMLCLGAPFGRYSAGTANGAGNPNFNSVGQFDAAGVLQNMSGTSTTGSGYDVSSVLPNPPGGGVIMAGATWYFQTWFRDGNRSNFSSAVCVTFN
jgi:hypothetical protein